MQFHITYDGALYLHNYYPVRYEEHKGISAKILGLKNGDPEAIGYFFEEIRSALDEYCIDKHDILNDAMICIVPSHEKDTYEQGLYELALFIGKLYGMDNAYNLIKRHTTHEKCSLGGD